MSPSAKPRNASAIDALGEAVSHMRAKLFPFSFMGWVTLGFVSLLESCGSGSGSGSMQNKMGNGGSGPLPDPVAMIETGFGWIAEHMILFVSVLMGLMLISLVFMWVRSRTIFVYIDDVATGRFDLVRPWGEHGSHADSFFVLSLIVQGASFILMVLILGLGGFFVLWTRANEWSGLATALGLLPILFLFFLALVVAAILGLVLRDFIAPLQISRNVGAREATGVFVSLLGAHPGLLIGYALLKLVVSIAVGMVILIGSCVTCCIGALPLINQTLFQPIYYAERAWSLKLLAQLGEDVFAKLDRPAFFGPDDAPTAPIDLSQVEYER
jgi:hypothetical protein